MSVSLQSGCEIKYDYLLQAVAGQFEDRPSVLLPSICEASTGEE
jgi:hypothetical protein